MTLALIALVIVAAAASRPLEIRLWRSGRISDRVAAALLLARFPIVCFLFGLILGLSAPLLAATTAIGTIPGIVAYQLAVDQFRAESRSHRDDQVGGRPPLSPPSGSLPELRLSVAADFSREWEADVLMGIGVASDHSIVGLIAEAPFSRRRRWRVATHAVIVGPSTRRVPIARTEFRWGVQAQLAQDGGLVLVGGRRDRDEVNAIVLDGDGHYVASFGVGDGVESALVDEEDGLWVSYFDEGTTGGDPLSSAGLNRFALNGERTWSFEPTYDLEPIVDCYALNVTGSSAWAYVYPSFDLIHVRDDRVRRWRTRVAGAHGLLVVDDDAVVLVGSYEDRLEAFRWGLDEDALGNPIRVVVTSTNGHLPQAPDWVGRGDMLWAVESGVCWRAELVG